MGKKHPTNWTRIRILVLIRRRRFSIVLTKFSPRSFCARKSGTKRHRICIRNARNDFKTRRKRTRSARFFSFHAKRGPARSSRRRRRRSVFFLDDDAVSPDDARLGERLHLSVCFLVEQALKKKYKSKRTLVVFEVSRTFTESSRVGFGGTSRASARFDASLWRFFFSSVTVRKKNNA